MNETRGEEVRSFSMDTSYLFDQYESLRKEALGSTGWRGHGLALFLSRGMKAWLEALTAFVPMTSPEILKESASQNKLDLPPTVRPDLTLVLADMVLACYQEAIG
jgi:hypothetical protein